MSLGLGVLFETERPRVEGVIQSAVARLSPPVGAAAAYSVRAGGKRVRPLLVVASHRALADARPVDDPELDEGIYEIAAAVELVHTYSLLHDDLPSMDDDAMRRGLPTTHRVYGVDVATAAGAALQQLAFLTLARGCGRRVERTLALPAMLRRLAVGAGVDGMVGGQYLDLEAEGRSVDGPGLEAIHRAKTAALIATACALGGMAAGGEEDDVAALSDYGTYLGLVFQIVDDLLDETGDPLRMGKATGADRERSKATYPSVYGVEDARELAGRVAGEARSSLGRVHGDTAVLAAFVDYVLERLE
ncbi:MAG: polyprenyl synthetase family protein [Gemmatimonadota bacterium]